MHLLCLSVTGEGQRTVFRSLFSPSSMCILEIEVRLSGLVAHDYLLSHVTGRKSTILRK